jgi:hypothetical protein
VTSHRTTARGTLLLVLTLLTLAAGAAAAPPAKIIFPVLGQATYTDDFGEPRAGGVHQGIDIMAPKRNLALAAEAGKVEFWATSASAGCMLYLHGASGTTYNYIHLNNDLTAKNDNRGKCVAGTAYAKGLKNGAKVVAGQPIGYVGDSGDAIQIRCSSVGAWPMRQRQSYIRRRLLVLVPETATVQRVAKPGGPGTPTALANAKVGQQVVLWTSPAPTTLKAQRGDDLSLSAALVSLVAG